MVELSRTQEFDLQLEGHGHATGFAAIAIAIKSAWEKVKSYLTGNNGHSNIHVDIDGCIHVTYTETVKYDAEDAEIAQRHFNEDWDNLPDHMDNLCKASKTFGSAMLDISDECNERIHKLIARSNELDEEEDEAEAKRREKREERYEAESKRRDERYEAKNARAASKAKFAELAKKAKTE